MRHRQRAGRAAVVAQQAGAVDALYLGGKPDIVRAGPRVALPIDQQGVIPVERLPAAVQRCGSKDHIEVTDPSAQQGRVANERKLPHGPDLERRGAHGGDVAVRRVQLAELRRQDRSRRADILLQVDRLRLRQVHPLVVHQHLVDGGRHHAQQHQRDHQFDEGKPSTG